LVGIEPRAAFIEFIDHKWRGPPLTLLDLARITETINGYKPQYNISGGNCYMFARLVFYAVALRHYSFPFFASSVNMTANRFSPRRWIAPEERSGFRDLELFLDYESSSTGRIFNVLYHEEYYSGALLLRRLLIIISVLYIPAIIGTYHRFVWFGEGAWYEWLAEWALSVGGLGVVGSVGEIFLISGSFIPILLLLNDDDKDSPSPTVKLHHATRSQTKFVMQQFGMSAIDELLTLIDAGGCR
jgi:hypothetical protein